MSAFILTLSCRNRPGLVAAVSSLIFHVGGDITEAQQFDDRETGLFFMRVVFRIEAQEAELRQIFAPLAREHQMDWRLTAPATNQRVLLMVSKFDHCLLDLLYRSRIGELAMDVVGIVSNHPPGALNLPLAQDIRFWHLPVTRDDRPRQEAELKEVVATTGTDLVVLARYMQILSNDLATHLAGRCINIHHSFLPGFKGARPYHQAHARGVKMIGATAHYVTGDLDEGPIIHQDVERVSHADTPDDLVRKGRNIEQRVLSRAVLYHLQQRVMLNGSKTVVFSD